MSNQIRRNSGLGEVVTAAFEKTAAGLGGDLYNPNEAGPSPVKPPMPKPAAPAPMAPPQQAAPQKVSMDLVKTWRNELAGADPAQQAQMFESFIQPFKGTMSPEQIEGIKKAVGVQSAPTPVPQVNRIPAAQPPAPAAPTV